MQTQALVCTLDVDQTKVSHANHRECSQMLSHCHYGLREKYQTLSFLLAKILNPKWY